MNLLLPTLISSVAVATAVAGESCSECKFQGQISGQVYAFIDTTRAIPIFHSSRIAFNFDVDYTLKRARIYFSPDKNKRGAWGESEWFQDLENNIMYRIPYDLAYYTETGVRKPAAQTCLSMTTPPELRIPTCVPDDFEKGILDYRIGRSGSIRIRDGDGCVPITMNMKRPYNASNIVQLDMWNIKYHLQHTTTEKFFSDTKDCIPTTDWDYFFLTPDIAFENRLII